MEEADLLDGAGDVGGFDEVADAEWPQPQEHHAGSDIRQRPLEREADGEAGGAERGEHRGGLHAELPERGDDAPG